MWLFLYTSLYKNSYTFQYIYYNERLDDFDNLNKFEW